MSSPYGDPDQPRHGPYPGQPHSYHPPPPGYGYGYGYPYPYYPPYPYPVYPQPAPPPEHPRAPIVLGLGIAGLALMVFCCGLGLTAPFAWVMGRRVLKEIDASHGAIGGRGSAQAGYILGIVGTIVLALALVGIVVFIMIAFVSSSTSTT